jgi:cbb3-type cytochrome oxidase maturation protein
MNILYVLIPLSLVLMGGAIWALFWAVDAGQFEKLDEAGASVVEADDAKDQAPT